MQWGAIGYGREWRNRIAEVVEALWNVFLLKDMPEAEKGFISTRWFIKGVGCSGTESSAAIMSFSFMESAGALRKIKHVVSSHVAVLALQVCVVFRSFVRVEAGLLRAVQSLQLSRSSWCHRWAICCEVKFGNCYDRWSRHQLCDSSP